MQITHTQYVFKLTIFSSNLNKKWLKSLSIFQSNSTFPQQQNSLPKKRILIEWDKNKTNNILFFAADYIKQCEIAQPVAVFTKCSTQSIQQLFNKLDDGKKKEMDSNLKQKKKKTCKTGTNSTYIHIRL